MLSREQQIAMDGCVYLTKAGSHLYGTNTPESDTDYVGVFVPPQEYFFGLKRIERVEFSTKKSTEQRKNTSEDCDCIMYSATKFVQLLIGNNPNILETFYAPEECIVFKTPAWDRFTKEIYGYVLSKRCDDSFIGFAASQLHKLETKGRYNTGRQDLIQKFGYDTKCMYHAIRLLYEASEIAGRGELKLPLCPEYRNHLLSIRKGEVSFFAIREIYVALLNSTKELFRDPLSPLAKTPNVNTIDAALCELNKATGWVSCVVGCLIDDILKERS
jgi:predicted nucleotidyltransferase